MQWLNCNWWHFACCMTSLHHIWISWFMLLTCLAIVNTLTACSTIPSIDSRPSIFSHRSIHSVEFPAVEYSVFTFSTCLLSTSKEIPLQEAFSRVTAMTIRLPTVLRSCGLWNSLAILATLTNSDRHWQKQLTHSDYLMYYWMSGMGQ